MFPDMKTKFQLRTLLLLPAICFAADSTVTGIPNLGESFLSAVNTNPYANSGKSAPVAVTVEDSKPGIAIQTEYLLGADLAIWNSPTVYHDLKPYLVDAGFHWFRFPNGSLSNDYHWNGKGKYNADGIWISEVKDWSPGFLGETKWRGTSKNNYGFRRPSHLTDGDTATMWWGALYDRQDPPWFVIDLGQAGTIDSLLIHWGEQTPKAFTLAAWDSTWAPYPYPHQLHLNLWKASYQGKVKGQKSSVKFTPKAARYWAVRFEAKDLGKNGVQVREVQLFSQGMPATNNTVDPGKHTRAWGISTHSGDIARTDWTGIKWDFEGFMDLVRSVPNGRPVICVNAAMGSPEEAAAWVRYANKVKGYGIKDWQIGNELDGEWEEAGPFSARHYAARFLTYAKAMKAVDPSIRIYGPVFSTDEFLIKGDGTYSQMTWMERFLKIVGEAEKKDKKRWLDGMDMHTYPYWTAASVVDSQMVEGSARPGPNWDSLNTWMQRHLSDPQSRLVNLSEFSSTVNGTSQTQRAVQGTALLHLFGQFVSRFGDRGLTLPWDTYGGLQTGPDGTMGSLRMANPNVGPTWSNWKNYSPSSQYFAFDLAMQHWTRPGFRVLPTSVTDSAVRAFALGNGDTTHVLLINMANRTMPVQVNRNSGKSSPGQVFVFGEDNFRWKGHDENAVAVPGMGAWSNRLDTDAQITLSVPALGVAVVQWDPEPLQANAMELQHLGLQSSVLLPGDTLRIWATLRQKDGAILSGTYKCGPFAAGDLPFADGKAGGEMEGVFLQIPIPKDAKPSEYRIAFEVEGHGQEGLAESIPFRVRGSYRSIFSLADFDGQEPSMFTYAHGNNTSSITPNVVPGGKPLGGHLRAPFVIEQPAEQGWPNFVGVHFPIERNLVEGNGMPGVPEGTRVSGVVFDYATQHSDSTGYFELLVASDLVKDYNEFVVRLRHTHSAWVRDTVLWSEMSQESWGILVGALQARHVKELEFRARGQGSGSIRLDNITLLGEEGKEIPLPQMLRRLR